MRDADAIFVRDAEKRAALLFDVRPKRLFTFCAAVTPRFRERPTAAANYKLSSGARRLPSRSGPDSPAYRTHDPRLVCRSLLIHEAFAIASFSYRIAVENKEPARVSCRCALWAAISRLSQRAGTLAGAGAEAAVRRRH